jgi:hypothetical protein
LGPNIFLRILFSITSKAILSPQYKLPHSGPLQTSDTNSFVIQHLKNQTGEQHLNGIIASMDNIKMDLRQDGMVSTRLIWLRIEASGGLL